MTQRTLAYIVSRFPHLPETFILREIEELKRQGWQISIYPLILQKQPVVHPQALGWLNRTHYVPFCSGNVLAQNGRILARQPVRLANIWTSTAGENLTHPDHLWRSLVMLPKAVAMAEQIKRAGFRHIHAHYATYPALVAWAIHRLTGISYSVTAHAHDIFEAKPMLATKLRDASFIVSISHFNREYLARHLGEWVRAKIEIVHCGIDPAKYPPRLRRIGSDGCLEIVNVGSLQPYKGQRYLVQACAVLKRRGIPVHCRIIGGGEEHTPLARAIAAAGVEDCVELLGPLTQDQVADILRTADVYVQPSVITRTGKMEGIPVALMEAMASNLPVVATDVGGVSELVQPGDDGWLVRPGDAYALADALAQIWTAPDEAEARAVRGRAVVLDNFVLESNVRRLARLFQDRLEGVP